MHDNMPPDELRDALARLQLSQNGLAAWLGANERTARRWADPVGEGAPAAVAKLLRFMLARGLAPDDIDREIAMAAAGQKRPGKAFQPVRRRVVAAD